MRALLSVALAVALGGCFPRVTLPDPPSAGAPRAVREQAFADFTGTKQRPPTPDGGSGPTDHLLLGNGRKVMDPRDLVPWVAPDSATAAFATSFETSQSRASVLGLAAVAFPIVPMAALVATLAVKSFSNGPPRLGDSTALIAGVGVGTLISMGLMITSIVLAGVALTEREQAFDAYPADLAHRLGLTE